MATLSPALDQYIGSHYTPAQAALVVRSAQSLEALEAQVKKRLSQVPAKASGGDSLPEFDALNFSRDALPLEIQVKSLAGPASLFFYFPVAGLKQFEASHSYAIAEYLLTRRGREVCRPYCTIWAGQTISVSACSTNRTAMALL